MHTVIDTGVYIAAMLSASGAPAQLMRLWRLRQFDMIVSPKLLDELDQTLRRDRFRTRIAFDDIDEMLTELRRSTQVRADPNSVPPVSRDPNDDYLIALAQDADADALVSGDRDLTDLVSPPVRILTPRMLLDELTHPHRPSRDQP